MAVTITDNRTIRSEADATTGWTGTATLSVFTTDPAPIEATGMLGATVGAIQFDAYHSATAANFSNAVIYCWVFSRLALGNTNDANGGLMIYVGDATNAGGFKVAGADRAAFRHDTGPVGWQCPALDTQNLPASPVTRAGNPASINYSALTRMGISVNSLVAAPGMNPTCLVDIIRVLDPTTNDGCGLTITGGTSGDPGTFDQIAAADRLTGNQQAHGAVRELAAGAFGCQVPLRFGNPTGTSSSWFEDKNKTFVFENRGFRNTLYKIYLTDNGVGTTTFKLGTKVGTGTFATGVDGCNLIAPPGVGAEFDAYTNAEITDVFLYGSLFSGFTNGIRLWETEELIGCTINACGTVDAYGTNCVNTRITNSTAAQAMLWDHNLNTDGRLDGVSYSSGGGGHGLRLGPDCPSNITLRRVNFTGYAPTDGDTSDEAIYNASGKEITINIDGGNTPSVRNSVGSTTIVVSGLVTLSFTVQNLAGTPLTGYEWRLYEEDPAPGIIGTIELAGEENAASSSQSYSYSYSSDEAAFIQIIHIGYEELLQPVTLGNTNQNFTLRLITEENI